MSVLMKNDEMIAGVVPKPKMTIIENVTIVVSANNNYGTINVSDINLETTGLKMLSVYNKNSGNPINCSLNSAKTVFNIWTMDTSENDRTFVVNIMAVY